MTPQARPYRSCVVHRPFQHSRRRGHRPSGTAESVKAAVNWEGFYTAETGPLKGCGAWRDGRCPFHNDRCPSLRVNVKTGCYWCPVCGAHGDGIGFLMQRDGLAFAAALKTLEGRA